MATLYKNTGKARATKLVIHRKVNGVDITGFPITYNLLNAIPGVGALSLSELKLLTDAEYVTRRDAFIAYADSQTGYTAPSTGSVITDVVTCPVDGYVNP